jgi:hypothetical protein
MKRKCLTVGVILLFIRTGFNSSILLQNQKRNPTFQKYVEPSTRD